MEVALMFLHRKLLPLIANMRAGLVLCMPHFELEVEDAFARCEKFVRKQTAPFCDPFEL